MVSLRRRFPALSRKKQQAHQGTADHGHFYSLIRTDGDQWLEFNDRRVTPYDPANIPRDCFGGGEPGAPQVSFGSTAAIRPPIVSLTCAPGLTFVSVRSSLRTRSSVSDMLRPSSVMLRLSPCVYIFHLLRIILVFISFFESFANDLPPHPLPPEILATK